ncbi:hypothetical protein KKB18_01535, partial [bacterium]|nr:hypothetical protein [bacterium]
ESTDEFGKGKFKELTPTKYKGDRKYFLSVIIEYFSIESAISKNQSFCYFIEKFIPKQQFLH